MKYKIAILAVYFGKLPEYFDLWLNSCRFNSSYDWILFTDADLSTYTLPSNVKPKLMTLDNFKEIASTHLDIDVEFSAPYKVCDFRPCFGMLLDKYEETYDFWGHCDIDMIFGNLNKYITDEILEKHSKIFTVGHLTLYKNDVLSNNMFKENSSDLDWKKILSSSQHFGFDEHIGVNKIWNNYPELTYKNESIIADIDPNVRRFELCIGKNNFRNQIFYFDNGRILQGGYKFGVWYENEFMYIHFQKRKFIDRACRLYSDRFICSPFGFYDLNSDVISRSAIKKLNGINFRDYFYEIKHRARRKVKQWKI